MSNKKILIIEDEESIAQTLVYAFETEGYQPIWASKSLEGLEVLNKEKVSLVILDIGLPDIDGFETCRRIRTQSNIPIFFLTARNDEIDRILGLEIGADDYITKPFSPREVTARVKSLFRRVENYVQENNSKEYGPFSLDNERLVVLFEGQKLDLRRYEFGILKFLMESPGRVYSRSQIMNNIWDEPDMSMERTVDAHIKVIRSHLKKISPSQEWIITHRGSGYSLREF